MVLIAIVQVVNKAYLLEHPLSSHMCSDFSITNQTSTIVSETERRTYLDACQRSMMDIFLPPGSLRL